MLTRSPRRHIKKLAEHSADEYDIGFVDEVLFQQQGSRCRMWIPPEVKQPVVMQETGVHCRMFRRNRVPVEVSAVRFVADKVWGNDGKAHIFTLEYR